MKWKTGKEMLDEARSEGYGVGAFTAHNAETIQGILWAAAEMDSGAHLAKVLGEGGGRVKQKVMEKIDLFGSGEHSLV